MSLTEKDMQDIDKQLDEEVKTNSTEAPLSIHIDAYYRGFHAGITIRKEDNSVMPISKIKESIDKMISEGFEASWNKETSASHQGISNATTKPRGRVCEMHQDIEVRQSKTGKWYHKNEQTDEFCFGKGYIKFNK